MREIKFRAWNGYNMILPRDGAYYQHHVSFCGGIVQKSSEVMECFGGGDRWNRVDNLELMQFTGLQDKNGVDIYEGDIVSQKLNCLWDEGRHNLEVRFNHDQFQTGNVKSYSSLYSAVQSFDAEIIGNIHQHSELIK
jgi:uncharacterized phage protein (TIGR01671 family)